MEHKSLNPGLDIKQTVTGVNRISGYASVFNNVDSHGDIILKGSFTKTIERIADRKINLYSSHDMDARELLGTITMLREDDYGLYFEADISSAPSAQDIAIKAKEGHLDEVSIGFFMLDSEYVKDEASGQSIRVISEIELVEISLVSRASNPKAKILQVKKEQAEMEDAEQDDRIIEEVMEKHDDVLDGLAEKLAEELIEKSVEGESSELQTVDSLTEPNKNKENKMSEEKNINEDMVKAFEEKLAKFEELMNQPIAKTPFEVEEEKSEEPVLETRSEAEMHNEASALFYDYAKGDLTKREYEQAIEEKALSSVVVEDGAALVPERLHNEIVQKLDRITKIEALVTKLNGNGPLDILDYSFDPTWSTHDDGGTISETSISSIFGKSTLDPQDYAALVTIPNRLERRSFQSIQPLLAGDFARAYNELKEDKIMQGSGHKEPLGVVTLLTDLSINTENITAIANLDYDALVNVTFKLNEEYRGNAAFFMHPDALKQVMKLTDSQNLPIWNRPVSAGNPATLLGYPVIETRALEDGNASGESPVVFADMSKYIMLEEKAFSVEASRDANFSSNKLTLRMVVSFDGMPVDKNAFAMIEIT